MKFGEMVMITEGYQKDTIGYISAIPNKSVGRNEYVISTKEYPCGQWLTEKQFYVIPFDNNSYKDITSTRNVYMEYYQYLPDNIDPFLYFTEMAEIAPDYNRSHNIKNGFRVWMEPNEGPIPHIHIVFKDKKRAYIKLGAPEYLNGHENKSYHLNSIDCKNLQRFFESTIIQIDSNGEEIETTIWMICVNTWRQYIGNDPMRVKAFNSAFQKDNNEHLIMPDYSKGIISPK